MNKNAKKREATEKKMAELMEHYYTINEKKKSLTSECKDIGDEIKELMEEADTPIFAAKGLVATATNCVKRTINVKAVEKLLGRALPDSCFTFSPYVKLEVKVDAAAGVKPLEQVA